MSKEVMDNRAKVEADLLAAIQRAIDSGNPIEAEQWTHAYLQFALALQAHRL